ncbi:hypothetical protein IWQ60_001612 [Tieghemiomyces parasiticus]|uniref:Uncharacterized protein n=1 Tax=Tieghemiomyces parasiticus TaxID=78921 RepID=A0A9W8E2D8_9FUNG|nr:hypothetical protein IWQ60_001612 [Tieghemiomyces parasiticus]
MADTGRDSRSKGKAPATDAKDPLTARDHQTSGLASSLATSSRTLWSSLTSPSSVSPALQRTVAGASKTPGTSATAGIATQPTQAHREGLTTEPSRPGPSTPIDRIQDDVKRLFRSTSTQNLNHHKPDPMWGSTGLPNPIGQNRERPDFSLTRPLAHTPTPGPTDFTLTHVSRPIANRYRLHEGCRDAAADLDEIFNMMGALDDVYVPPSPAEQTRRYVDGPALGRTRADRTSRAPLIVPGEHTDTAVDSYLSRTVEYTDAVYGSFDVELHHPFVVRNPYGSPSGTAGASSELANLERTWAEADGSTHRRSASPMEESLGGRGDGFLPSRL